MGDGAGGGVGGPATGGAAMAEGRGAMPAVGLRAAAAAPREGEPAGVGVPTGLGLA